MFATAQTTPAQPHNPAAFNGSGDRRQALNPALVDRSRRRARRARRQGL